MAGATLTVHLNATGAARALRSAIDADGPQDGAGRAGPRHQRPCGPPARLSWPPAGAIVWRRPYWKSFSGRVTSNLTRRDTVLFSLP